MGVGSGAGILFITTQLFTLRLYHHFITEFSIFISFPGEIDLEMLAQLHLKHPHVKVDNEVVEPSNDMLHKYKGTSHFTDAHIS